jgi:hypothetical protein
LASTDLLPGDVLAVRTSGIAGFLIRLGALIEREPDLDNHIAVVHHTDAAGITWCIEGRPGGVGWADAATYLSSRWTVTNALQPKIPAQRDLVCSAMMAAIGTPYDWDAIANDAAQMLHLPELFAERWDGQVPGHVVCSSLAAWGYMKGGLAYPEIHDMPRTLPADWEDFDVNRLWEEDNVRH